MNRTAIGAMVVAVLSFAACGGDDGGGSGNGDINGVDKGKQVSSLTVDEQTALCNWYAPQVGGYGAADACPMVGGSAPADVNACLDDFPSCAITVGDLAACYTKIISAETTCTAAANQAAITSSACQTAAVCFQ